MIQYDNFAPYYDAVMGDRRNVIEIVNEQLARHTAKATSLLELGCGTGALLGNIDVADRWGIDRSAGMLKVAKQNVPAATFRQANIINFTLPRTFEAAICLFDTLNHLTSLTEWQKTFERTAAHLPIGGFMLIDFVTTGRLKTEIQMGMYEEEIPTGYVTMQAYSTGINRITLTIAVEITEADGVVAVHEESITETAYPLVEIRPIVSQHFNILEEFTAGGESVSDRAGRVYFACCRK